MFIDNKNKTLCESLKNSLSQADNVDILTAFFYFSGFNELADELKDKKIRILVGLTIDQRYFDVICGEEESENYTISDSNYRKLSDFEKEKSHIQSFINSFNKKDFNSTKSKLFLSKIKDGSLEIKSTFSPQHGKMYILTNKLEYSHNGEQKGVVFFGSSNFTKNGLSHQRELNKRYSDNRDYDDYKKKFEELWEDSVPINKDNLIKNFEKTYIFANPTPYQIFIRILYELFSIVDKKEIKTPDEITKGKFFNFKYQLDAVKLGIDCINKNNGVIIADVVGLGKSIIASTIAHNLNMQKTIIITPPHLSSQWKEYQQEFGLRGVRVYSSGKIDDIYNKHLNDSEPILYIIDEAHKYRNESNINYQKLHQLTRSNPNNKVILLTATPYNNKPNDLFALIKLFQTPNRSTIYNLNYKFHELIEKYDSLNKNNKNSNSSELEKISNELRILIDPIIIRRNRIDLKEIKEYDEDLKKQNIDFPEIIGPELIEYDLGEIRDLYSNTLDKLSKKITCACYNPYDYLVKNDLFDGKYGYLFKNMNIRLSQKNSVQFIKRLFVRRFESSKSAFESTLKNLLKYCEKIKKYYEKGWILMKKGYLEDPEDDEILELLKNDICEDHDKKKHIPIEKNFFSEKYIHDINNDIELLKNIYDDWFGKNKIIIDPKLDEVSKKINYLIKENKDRKIVIFTSYIDTAEYIHENLKKKYKIFIYTGDSSKKDRDIVYFNFDASVEKNKQLNDYDILIATDAISEGFNLNRSGVIINYDIPYNPAIVIQRIGRINRINKKMFNQIFIYNLFPTDIGELNTSIKNISTSKMLFINLIIGNDTKILTQNETPQGFFKRQYEETNIEENKKSWDVYYRNIFNSIKNNTQFIEKICKIPEKTKIVRFDKSEECLISFVKKGNNFLFAIAHPNQPVKIVSADLALKFFKAEEKEKSSPCDSELDNKFILLKNEISKPYPKIKFNNSNKTKAIDVLEELKVFHPEERKYLDELIEVIKNYDDLSNYELKFIKDQKNCSNNDIILKNIKDKIPDTYITQIMEKVKIIDSQTETIIFTEDLRK